MSDNKSIPGKCDHCGNEINTCVNGDLRLQADPRGSREHAIRVSIRCTKCGEYIPRRIEFGKSKEVG
jgi:hypothetical protein